MTKSRLARWLIIAVLTCLSGYAQSANINDIRMWHTTDRTRIVFDIDKKPQFNVFTLQNPERVVIDLDDTQMKGRLPSKGTTGRYISDIRTGNPDSDTLRVVFDIAMPVRYLIQLLSPVDQHQYRLVMDYYHNNAVVEHKILGSPMLNNSGGEGRRRGDVVVVIDPGHGGKHPGAVGKQSKEKKIVLQISKKIKQLLDREPGIKVELTRQGDQYVRLKDRTRYARKKQADLFVSVHADAFKDSKARGASVYALSRRGATSETARWLADKENAEDLVGGVSLSDKENVLASVLLDLSMTRTISESVSLGKEVLDELKKIGRIHSNKVEQAAFVVLKSPDIPSILVETAYISNPYEEKLLRSPKHQLKIAKAIVAGIKRYLRRNQNLYAYYH